MALRRPLGSVAQAYLRLPVALPPPPPPSFLYPLSHFSPFRSFAAPPQPVKRDSKEDGDGPRINNAIISPFIRLVSDQGHTIVPRHEALNLASRMSLDLVEVDRKADPPVCKIIDFHKEKYNKDAKDKERIKTKSAIALRGGDCKEVRFKAKTESKDLKVKADGITRLMERGYRVKCMAVPSGRGVEDFGGPLSRLLELIQDVCTVESGPHMDSKHAFVIVRHVKFATKKGGKKASQAIEDVVKGTPPITASESPDVATNSEAMKTEYSHESSTQKQEQDRGLEREFKSNPGNSHENLHNRNAGGSRINAGQEGTQSSRNGNSHMEKPELTNQDMRPGQTNRYVSRRPQMGGDNQGISPQAAPRRNENENQRPLEQPNQPLPRFTQGRLSQEARRTERGSHIPPNSNQRQSEHLNQPAESAGASKSLGVFSNRKPVTPELKEGTSSSKAGNTDSTKSFGIFSKPRREVTPELKKDLTSSSKAANGNSAKSFGIFSKPRGGKSS